MTGSSPQAANSTCASSKLGSEHPGSRPSAVGKEEADDASSLPSSRLLTAEAYYALNCRPEVVASDRLGQEIIHAGRETAFAILAPRARRQTRQHIRRCIGAGGV